jgi:hypothetical protein
MNRPLAFFVAVLAAAAALGLEPPPALAQATTVPPRPPSKFAARSKAPAEPRFRLVLDFAALPGATSYGDVRTPTAYAEPSRIATSYDAGTGLGGGGALQVSLYRGLGLLAGYSHVSRDASGTVDVSRPHPLYLNRPRTASADLPGTTYSEGAIDVDAAYARSSGRIDWTLFGGVTFFSVEAELLDVPTFNEVYPYDTLAILSTPSVAVKQNATGFNLGGRLDYRFGQQKRFGAGVTLRYGSASIELAGTQVSTPATLDAGGFSVGGGLRVYF